MISRGTPGQSEQARSAVSVSRRTLLAASIGVAGLDLGQSSRHALAQTSERPVRGGRIRGAAVTPVTSLDPLTSMLGSADAMCYQAIYNTLVDVSIQGDIVPELASAWTISEDGLTYAFTLIDGIVFHDGSPLDAAAVRFNVERYSANDSTWVNADRLRMIAAIEVPDSATLVITLSKPNAPFMATLASCSIVSPTAVEELADEFWLRGTGSGPFMLSSWTPGFAATFVRNDHYWEIAPDGEPFPYADELVISGEPGDEVRLDDLRAGNIDLNERVQPQEITAIETDPTTTIVETTMATAYVLAMNVTREPFDNPALRRAVSAAIDRQVIIDAVGSGTGYTASMPFPRGAWFFIDDPAPVFDIETASALLTEAGYPDGLEVKFCIIDRPIDNDIALIVKDQLAAVGIRTRIVALKRTTWVDLWDDRQGELGMFQRGAGGIDPDEQSALFSTTNIANFAGYDSPEILDLIDQANRTVDQGERLALWKEIAGIMVEDAVYVPIGCIPAPAARRMELRDVAIVQSDVWKLDGTWLSG